MILTIKTGKRQLFKWIITAIVAVFLVIVLFIMGYATHYYMSTIYPEYDRVSKMLADADSAHRQLPESVGRMLNISFGCVEINNNQKLAKTCRQRKNYEVTRLITTRQQERHLHFQLRQLLISNFIINGLNDHEKNTLISDLSYVGHSKDGIALYGLNDLSTLYYNKPLGELNLDEIATVVAIRYNPSRYRRDSEQLENRKQQLLMQYNQSLLDDP